MALTSDEVLLVLLVTSMVLAITAWTVSERRVEAMPAIGLFQISCILGLALLGDGMERLLWKAILAITILGAYLLMRIKQDQEEAPVENAEDEGYVQ